MKNFAPIKIVLEVGRGMQGKLSWPPDKYYTDKFDET